MKNMAMQKLLQQPRVLLLQGKMGTFFHRFATFLQDKNIQVHKINFNAGDAIFYWHKQTTAYRGTLDSFSDWLRDYINTHQINAVVCFSDCRPYHIIASRLCKHMSVRFFVMEYGYLRPDYITFEEHGINGFSQFDVSNIPAMPTPSELAKSQLSQLDAEEPHPPSDNAIATHNKFYRVIGTSIIYYAFNQGLRFRYPHYVHHREPGIVKESRAWLTALTRKCVEKQADQKLQQQMLVEYKDQYFLISLQVYNDSQITKHSNYDDVKEFITEVISSFAQFAKATHYLLFKHHPLDRGHRHYRKFIKQLAKKHRIKKRVFYGCDMHLPTMIKNSLGMVTINSTSGLQSIYHQKPTKVMGKAVYNAEYLTDQQPLDSFWQAPKAPNHAFYLRFREYLIEQSQLNGSFHGLSPWMNDY